MKTKRVVVCEKCEVAILREEDGFVIQGAILPAGAEEVTPIVGVAIPPNQTIAAKDVSTTAYCRGCLGELLGYTGRALAPQVQSQPMGLGASRTPHLPPGTPPSMPGGQPVGGMQQLAPGAFVNAGTGVLPAGNVEALAVIPRQIQVGSVVRVNERHKNFSALRGRSATVERFLDDEKAFLARLADGTPVMGKAYEYDHIG